jgi:transposase
MNRKPYKQYSREFKVEALRLATAADKPATQVARELGIRVNQLHKWKQQLEAEEASGMPAKRGRPVDGELDRLRRENAKLKEENDLLKKAAIFFARESK